MSVELKSLKNYIKLFLLIVILLSDCQVSSQDFNDIPPRQTTLCSERNMPGLICESCNRLAFCVEINGIWQTYPVEPCDIENGEYCNVYEGKCSDSPGPCNRLGYEGNFPCTSDGVFPDPYDCQVYHMCYQAEPDVHDYLPIAGSAKCEGNRAYSVITSDCTLTLLDDVCKKKQYSCEYPGETHSWPDNPNIFYICQPEVNNVGKYFLYPTLYRCGPDEIYSESTCILRDNNGQTTLSTSVPKPTLKTSTRFGQTTKTTTTESNSETLCTGKLGLKPDPEDCYSYYQCKITNGSPIHHTCPKNTYFNQITSSCAVGSC